MAVTSGVAQVGLLFVGQHDHSAIKIETFFHYGGNAFEQVINCQ